MPREKTQSEARAERVAQREAETGERATTINGAPYPLRSWVPDAAIDIQLLAEWADPLAKYAKLAAGIATLGSWSVPTSWNRVNVVATATNLYGGMTWDTTNRCFVVPYAGVYRATMWIAFDGVGSTAQAVAGVGSTTARWGEGTKGTSVSSMVNSLCTAIQSLAANDKVSGWTYASAAASSLGATLSIDYLGASA